MRILKFSLIVIETETTETETETTETETETTETEVTFCRTHMWIFVSTDAPNCTVRFAPL